MDDKKLALVGVQAGSSGAPTLEPDPRAGAVWGVCLAYLRANLVHADLDTLTWRRGESVYTSHELGLRIWREASGWPSQLIEITLAEMIERLRGNAIDRTRAELLRECSVEEQRSARAELDRFIRLIAHPDTERDRLRYYTLAMAQLIWQVKRRLRGERSWWEIMPVLVGAQGSGKSSAVDRFAAPLGLLYQADADFTIFTDPFRILALNRAYLVRLDEMGHARTADLERVKNRITAHTIQARAMRSEQERRLVRNASFIGTSNRALSDDIADPTGMRRFVEIRCLDTEYTDAWGGRMRSINYPLLWHVESGLDETAPLSTDRALCERFQSETRQVSDFDAFADSELIHTREHAHLLSCREAYDRYASLMNLQRIRPNSIQRFSRLMTARYGEPIRPGNAVHWRGVQLASIGKSEDRG